MGWWKSGNADDIIGDLPADEIGRALAMASETYLAQRGRRPSLEMVLGWVHRAIAASGGSLITDARDERDMHLVARTNRGTIASSGDASPEDAEIPAMLEAALETIALDYHDALQRLPRASEIAATLLFVLAANTLRYVDGPPGMEIDDIRIESGG